MDSIEDEQYSLTLGAADYIVKPLRPPNRAIQSTYPARTQKGARQAEEPKHDTLLANLIGQTIAGASQTSVSTTEQLLAEKHPGKLVLLAEDNLLNQEVALELLKAAGLSVDVAADGATAVEMAKQTA